MICGWANRRLSERYGLKVYLCLYHHTEGKESVHHNEQLLLELKKEAQIAFEKTYPELVFREVFGKNYLVEEVREPEPAADAGFIVTGNILTDANWLNEV